MKKDFKIILGLSILIIVFCAFAISAHADPTAGVYIEIKMKDWKDVRLDYTPFESLPWTRHGRNDADTLYQIVDCGSNTTACEGLKDLLKTKTAKYKKIKDVDDTTDTDYESVVAPTPTP